MVKETKVCNVCNSEKRLISFSKDKTRKDGRSYRCKACQSEHLKIKYFTDIKYRRTLNKNSKLFYIKIGKLQSKTPESKSRRKSTELKRTYGLTLNQYNILLAQQGSVCAICNSPPSSFKRALSVDHCHKTGNIRGILCVRCNRGIGSFKDNPELLSKAIEYLTLKFPLL